MLVILIKLALIIISLMPLGVLFLEYLQHPDGFGAPVRTFILLGSGPLLITSGIIASFFSKGRPALARIETVMGLVIMFLTAMMSFGLLFLIVEAIIIYGLFFDYLRNYDKAPTSFTSKDLLDQWKVGLIIFTVLSFIIFSTFSSESKEPDISADLSKNGYSKVMNDIEPGASGGLGDPADEFLDLMFQNIGRDFHILDFKLNGIDFELKKPKVVIFGRVYKTSAKDIKFYFNKQNKQTVKLKNSVFVIGLRKPNSQTDLKKVELLGTNKSVIYSTKIE